MQTNQESCNSSSGALLDNSSMLLQGVGHPGELEHRGKPKESKQSTLVPFHVKQKGLNTSRGWKQGQWNIPAKETLSVSLKRTLEVTWVPQHGSTFARVTSALRQRANCRVNQEPLCDSVSFSSSGPETHSAHLTDGAHSSCFIYLTPGFPFQPAFEQKQKNSPHMSVGRCHRTYRRWHLQSGTLSVERSWQLTYNILSC